MDMTRLSVFTFLFVAFLGTGSLRAEEPLSQGSLDIEVIKRLSAFEGTVWGDLNTQLCGFDFVLKDQTTLLITVVANPFSLDKKQNSECLRAEEISFAKWDSQKKAFREDYEYVEPIGARTWKMTRYFYVLSPFRIYMERYARSKKGGKDELDAQIVFARARGR